VHQPVSRQHQECHQTAASTGASGDDSHTVLLPQRLLRLLTGGVEEGRQGGRKWGRKGKTRGRKWETRGRKGETRGQKRGDRRW